ncbi:hypothetical protein RHP75_08430 [Pseudomonas sp. SG20056]|uniref:hypothetical protein n=1 Tax=Pseudomonas sp. SG20056 TaxID=3074146 RepID=UPI00287F968D|nr:hypothetical protein [Pseudomonas sp. SG20056]WNF48424.1 hypothetical protein RHP75_08430 [Pseudomonas sp. SG20056]
MKLDLMRDASSAFPKFEDYESVTEMRVWHCKYKSMQDIGRFVNLKELVIATLPESSLDFLLPLKNLEYLKIVHLPKVEDISPLSELKSLVCLSLATLPNWDSSKKLTKIKTLEPISSLPRLKNIELFGVVPVDGSLDYLKNVKTLETARFSGYIDEKVESFYSGSNISRDFVPKSSFS